MSRLRLSVVFVVIAATLVGGCAGETSDERPVERALPPDLTAFVDQARASRSGREVFIRLVNDAEREIRVTRAEVSSPRFEDVTWTGDESFQNEIDLEFELPRGRCGQGSEADLQLTYRIDGGAEHVSSTIAADRYGAVGLFLDRDCAEQTMAETAVVELGEAKVVGKGADSVFELPVTFTPTGERDDVTFEGLEDTVLFRHAEGSASLESLGALPLGPADPPVAVKLRLVPTRCDPHALAEDKVGTLVGVHLAAADLPELASYYLPIGDERRALLRGFFTTHCAL